MRFMIGILVALCLPACAHEYGLRLDTALTTWVGQHPDRLVESWGAPSSSYTFENGSKALTYEEAATITRSFSRSYMWRPDIYSSSETCRINFFTDAAQKKIERFSYKGYPSICLDIFESTLKAPNKG